MIELLVGGVVTVGVSLITFALGSKKNTAETDKLDAETEKTEAETERIKLDNSLERLELIDKLMAKIDAMQTQIDEMQSTINRLEFNQCKGDLCPINMEYKKILERRKNRKKYIPKQSSEN